jgi:hypothetical protein
MLISFILFYNCICTFPYCFKLYDDHHCDDTTISDRNVTNKEVEKNLKKQRSCGRSAMYVEYIGTNVLKRLEAFQYHLHNLQMMSLGTTYFSVIVFMLLNNYDHNAVFSVTYAQDMSTTHLMY